MSTKSEEIAVQSECINVDGNGVQNTRNSGETGDSGVETCSATISTPPASELLPPERTINQILVNLNDPEISIHVDNNRTITSSFSISPDISDATDNLFSLDSSPTNKSDPAAAVPSEIDFQVETKNYECLEVKHIDYDDTKPIQMSLGSSTDINNGLQPQGEREEVPEQSDFSLKSLLLDGSTDKSLSTSRMSLDEQNNINTTTVSNSMLSRSAENLTITKNYDRTNHKNQTNDLNKEIILNEFANQKTKAVAKQKLTPEILTNIPETLQNIDAKYARIPKELLQPDLGSLVKNVHGILSSVSGSLKYAYNQTHKTQKPQIKLVAQPLPNTTIMDNIFEESVEKYAHEVLNAMEKSPVNHAEVMKEIENINAEGKEIKEESGKDLFKLQMESMERVIADQRKENALLTDRVRQKIEELQERDQSFKELEAKMDLMCRRAEHAEREKDAAVMRYASVECAAIEARRAADKAALAEKAAHAEMELLNNKLKSAHSEKQRICQLYDDKCHELSNSERESAKVRDEVKELEGRLKWTQSKLRMEMDAYKETAERAERLSHQVTELEAAKEAAATNATDSIRAKQLEQDLKECQAALILCKHEKEDLERRLSSTTLHLDKCTRERDVATSSLATATNEIVRLKESNLRLEEEAAELAALRAQAALADTLSVQLQRESERASLAEDALSCARAQAATCAARESSALAHAAALTAQHVAGRSAHSDALHKAQALELDNASLRERICSLEAEVEPLHAARRAEAERRARETRALARRVAELTEELAEANKKLEWEKGENSVMKKKHASAVKELNREMHRALKRCEQLEAKLSPTEPANNRTGSVSSLSSGESAVPHSEESVQTNGHADSLPDIQVREPDRQALIERIVSLQRAAARRSERCEFLEEHARQLTAELRGKARLLRHLLCALPAGAVASTDSDAHKKEIARLGGGAMAAVWGGDSAGMTLELSLEMNNKLQAVLEDALLKNITLKENMDTLGEEIARLKEQNSST